jgi:hypothetical protein
VYCFLTVYSGDANYVSVSDGSTTQCFTETMATPQVAAARQGGNGGTRLVTIDGRGSK